MTSGLPPKVAPETRSTMGGGPSKSGSGFSTFRVGKHGDSLVNVHQAVAAFNKPAKKKPSPKEFVAENGVVTCTPEKFRDGFKKLKKLAETNPGLIVELTDPLHPTFSARFTFGSTDQSAETLDLQFVIVHGISSLLKSAPAINIENFGVLSKTGDLAPVKAANTSVTTTSTEVFKHRITKSDINSGAAIDRIIADFDQYKAKPTDQFLVIGYGGRSFAKLWLPDAPIKVDAHLSQGELMAIYGFSSLKPKAIIGNNDLRKPKTIITALSFDLPPLGTPQPVLKPVIGLSEINWVKRSDELFPLFATTFAFVEHFGNFKKFVNNTVNSVGKGIVYSREGEPLAVVLPGNTKGATIASRISLTDIAKVLWSRVGAQKYNLAESYFDKPEGKYAAIYDPQDPTKVLALLRKPENRLVNDRDGFTPPENRATRAQRPQRTGPKKPTQLKLFK